MVNATATAGTRMARPAGMRARYRARRDRPVITRWRNTPSFRSVVAAAAPTTAATMNPNSAIKLAGGEHARVPGRPVVGRVEQVEPQPQAQDQHRGRDDHHRDRDHEAAALAQLQVLGGDQVPGRQRGAEPPRDGRPAGPRRGSPFGQQRLGRGGGAGHGWSPSRVVTDRNHSSSEARVSWRPYTEIPASTSRRLMSATSSREEPGGQGDGHPGAGEGRARGDPRLVDELRGPGRVGAVHLQRSGARAPGQLVDRALTDDPPAVHDRHRVAGALHLVQQVRRQHHGPAFVDQACDHRPHLVHPGRVEPVHGLVEDQQLRVAEQARGHAEALAHAHRVRGDLVVGARGQAHPLQRRPDPLARVAAPGRGQQAEVVAAGQVRVEPGLVDDRPDPGLRPLPLGRDRDPEQRHRAAVGPGQAEQGADQRGLARAVRPEVAERDAARDQQLDAVDRDVGPEPLGQAVGLHRPPVSRALEGDGVAGRAARCGA